jgi:dTDP-4-amino-4,6-dideoxygalactose transaminase
MHEAKIGQPLAEVPILNVPFYDIRAQYEELKQELDEAVLGVLASGAYVMGQNHDRFEAESAALHGCTHGIAVNSGTDALRILLDAANVGPGDEVITTAFTFVATAEVILQVGATPVFVDIEPDTLQIDASKIDAAVTSHTKAIMPIHLFGQLCDVDGVMAAANRHGLIVLEDAAQAIGSHKDGVYAGRFGIGAGFSFYVTKNLGAAGDGGLILTNDDGVAERCRSIRVHGMGRERYYYDNIGYTSRLGEIQAAVLRVKLKMLGEWNLRRERIAKEYGLALSDCGVKLPVTLPGNNHTWHQYTIRSARRDELQAFLRERGVGSMIYYPVPLHFHVPYRHLTSGEGSLPETERAAREVLSLPIHPHLDAERARYVAHCVREFALAGAAR